MDKEEIKRLTNKLEEAAIELAHELQSLQSILYDEALANDEKILKLKEIIGK